MNTIEIELTETTATLPKKLLLEILKENERLKEELETSTDAYREASQRRFHLTVDVQELRRENDRLRDRVLSIDNERAELQRWQDGASKILDALKLQELGKELGLTLGTDIASQILPGIQKLNMAVASGRCERNHLVKLLELRAERIEVLSDEVQHWRGKLREIRNLAEE